MTVFSILQQIVRNRIRDEWRRRRRTPEFEKDETAILVDDSPSPLEKAIGREKLDRYARALLDLEPSDREAIIARFELGMQNREIARELELASEDAARMKVKRAVRRLVDRMANGST